MAVDATGLSPGAISTGHLRQQKLAVQIHDHQPLQPAPPLASAAGCGVASDGRKTFPPPFGRGGDCPRPPRCRPSYSGCPSHGVIHFTVADREKVVSWAAHWGWLDLRNSHLSFVASTAAAYIISVLAVAELANDKLPKTPNRTTPGPLVARIVTGALSGAAIGASAKHFVVVGAILGGLGGIAGAFAIYEVPLGLPMQLISDIGVLR